MSMYTHHSSYIDCLDAFCGCGGSSQALDDEGIEVVYALNHNELSLASHAANFPKTNHDQCDISRTDPRRYRRMRWAWFSPSCVYHTRSRGKQVINRRMTALWDEEEALLDDPEADRSRATMQDVIRFSAVHCYDYLFVENVIEVMYWEHFRAWERELRALDYEIAYIFYNSMFSLLNPPPQSRDRWYAIAWKRWLPRPNLDFHPHAHCQHCDDIAYFRLHSPMALRTEACPSIIHALLGMVLDRIDWLEVAALVLDIPIPKQPELKREEEEEDDPHVLLAILQEALLLGQQDFGEYALDPRCSQAVQDVCAALADQCSQARRDIDKVKGQGRTFEK